MKTYIRQDYAKKIAPCHMFVWLGRITVQNMVKNRATIGSGQYTLLSRRPVQTIRIQINYGPECVAIQLNPPHSINERTFCLCQNEN